MNNDLLAYLIRRQGNRAKAVDAFLATLTPREVHLVKEAAVMGFVRGRMLRTEAEHPKDGAVLVEVVDACIAMPDLYPTIGKPVQPDPEESDEERADRLETERLHLEGNHEHCGVTCEIEFPSDMLRNAILSRAIPGSGNMLKELLRRAATTGKSPV